MIPCRRRIGDNFLVYVEEVIALARRCIVCAKQTQTGNNISHSHRKTRRTWKANVQRVRIKIGETPTRAYVCTKCLKANKVQRVV